MKKITIIILLLFGLQAIGIGNASTLIKKATQSTFEFQAVKNDGTPLTGLTNITLFYSQHYSTGTFTNLTSFGSPTEMAYGVYNATITAQMANCDYLVIIPTSTTTGFCQYPLKFKTTISDPANLATTDDGGTINATAGAIDTLTTYTGNTPQTGDSYAIVNHGTYGNSALNTAIGTRSTLTAPQVWSDASGVAVSTGVARLDVDYTTARAASITAIETDTAAMDTATELRTLLTGADVAVSTTTPAAIWTHGISGNEPTAAGYVITASTRSVSVDTAAIADAVWAENLTGLNEPTAGGYVISGSTVTGSGATAQQVWEYATRILTALDEDSTTIDLDNTSIKVSSFTATAQDNIGDNVWKYTLPGTYSGYQAGNLLYLDYIKNNTEF